MSILQSPISLHTPTYKKEQKHKYPLQFDCKISKYAYDSSNKTWIVGKPIPSLKLNKHSFYLFDFHICQRAEHPLNKVVYPLELQFLWMDENGYIVGLSYVADLCEETSDLFLKLLKEKPIEIPQMNEFWNYIGSLTTEPYESNVNWFVSAQKLRISKEVLYQLHDKSRVARLKQERNSRSVEFVSLS